MKLEYSHLREPGHTERTSRNSCVPQERYRFRAMTTGSFESALPSRLPSGRHGLTREAVVASQRGRLVDAMAQVVAEKGYPAATVADVGERAGGSRRTFYEQFADK